MDIPTEFSHRVFKTRISGMTSSLKKLNEITNAWPGSEIDVIYENLKPIVVIVFETQEDCLAFTLKYGKEYVLITVWMLTCTLGSSRKVETDSTGRI